MFSDILKLVNVSFTIDTFKRNILNGKEASSITPSVFRDCYITSIYPLPKLLVFCETKIRSTFYN